MGGFSDQVANTVNSSTGQAINGLVNTAFQPGNQSNAYVRQRSGTGGPALEQQQRVGGSGGRNGNAIPGFGFPPEQNQFMPDPNQMPMPIVGKGEGGGKGGFTGPMTNAEQPFGEIGNAIQLDQFGNY